MFADTNKNTGASDSMIRAVKKAVIPAAGWGTGLLPLTKAVPKELLPVFRKPVIQYVVEEAVAAGIEEIIIVTRRGKHTLVDHFDRDAELEALLQGRDQQALLNQVKHIVPAHVSVLAVRQRSPMGLGDAVLCCESVVGDQPFAILLPDVLMQGARPGEDLRHMINRSVEASSGQVLVQAVPEDRLHRYGVVNTAGVDMEPGGVTTITGLIEKPAPGQAPSRFAICGRYVLPAGIFDALRTAQPGVHGEVQLTDAMATLLERQPLEACHALADTVDCGTFEGLLLAGVFSALESGTLSAAGTRALHELISRDWRSHAD